MIQLAFKFQKLRFDAPLTTLFRSVLPFWLLLLLGVLLITYLPIMTLALVDLLAR